MNHVCQPGSVQKVPAPPNRYGHSQNVFANYMYYRRSTFIRNLQGSLPAGPYAIQFSLEDLHTGQQQTILNSRDSSSQEHARYCSIHQALTLNYPLSSCAGAVVPMSFCTLLSKGREVQSTGLDQKTGKQQTSRLCFVQLSGPTALSLSTTPGIKQVALPQTCATFHADH